MKRSVMIGLAGALLLGCGGGAHLSDSYGRSVRATLAAQRIAAPTQGTPAGLDSEEAAIIHAQYRESIGAPRARAGEDTGARVLMVEEPKDASRR